MKDGGEVLFIDWSTLSNVMLRDLIVPKKQAQEMFEKNGFILEREIDAGAQLYGMIFRKTT